MFLKLPWFVAPFQRPSALAAPCSSIKISIFVLGFATSRQSQLIKVSARDPRRTASWAPNPKGDQVPLLANPGMKPIAFKVLLCNTCPYWILLPQMLWWLVDGPSTLAKADRTLSGPTQHHCRRLCSLPALQCLQISQSLQHLPPTRTSLTLSVRIGQTRAELLFNIWPWFCSERTRTSSSTRQCKLSL